MTELAATLAEAWALLARGAADARHPARLVALATLAGDAPSLRTVGLRAARQAEGEIDMHTDALSHKIAEIAAAPSGAVLVWDPGTQVQLRLNGTLGTRPGTAGEWARVPEPSREAYGHMPAPGTPIAHPAAWEIAPDPERFTVLTLRLERIDHVSLDPAGHRRALFTRSDHWCGSWLSP